MAGYLGKSGAHLLTLAAIRNGLLDMPERYPSPQKVRTCNLDPEEIAQHDRTISRQERRQMARLAKKGRNK